MQKYKIGYTTGVYDMFHIGHLNILSRAKQYCDFLIVGVSTDELVNKEKNKTPVIPFGERVEILTALKYVDKVVPQVDKNKFAAWEKYQFNAMFVGSDWKGKPLFMNAEKQLNAVGVDVIYLEYTQNISSTKLHAVISALEVSYNG
ncbi:MAG: adenylyltransferase/cytidyltransferase family protein [Defluviitaleaceae bacterium]|nr:adenylyltransferase/cytidyltransferase family protein [Defluviitaleaceae bacterium]